MYLKNCWKATEITLLVFAKKLKFSGVFFLIVLNLIWIWAIIDIMALKIRLRAPIDDLDEEIFQDYWWELAGEFLLDTCNIFGWFVMIVLGLVFLGTIIMFVSEASPLPRS